MENINKNKFTRYIQERARIIMLIREARNPEERQQLKTELQFIDNLHSERVSVTQERLNAVTN